MKLITNTTPHTIVADENKKIRSVDDVYTPEHTDEDGNLIPEHFPYYTNIIYVPNSVTEKEMNELYVEEDVEE